jgi:bifunctional non-homologous end joining protein LigD
MFIVPSAAVHKAASPTSKGWLHEIKFDGFRVQLHTGPQPVIYSRTGSDFSKRFRQLLPALAEMPGAIIDAELVACDDDDKPDFKALMFGSKNLCLWCFDLLAEANDVRSLPLITRRMMLKKLLPEPGVLRMSASFNDPVKLLASCEAMGLEGVVSKKADQPYRSGKNTGWIKVKTQAWRLANQDRPEMFQRRQQTPVAHQPRKSA